MYKLVGIVLTPKPTVRYSMAMSKRVYTNSKEQILDAAEQVLIEKGPGSLSVDTVCATAKVSKGGFFYHFKTKDDLLQAMVERLIQVSDADIERLMADDPNPRGRFTRAYIKCTFGIENVNLDKQLALIRALMEVAATSPKLLELGRKSSEVAIAQVRKDGLPEELGAVLVLANDGLMFAEAFGMAGLNKKDRQKVVDFMLRMTEQRA